MSETIKSLREIARIKNKNTLSIRKSIHVIFHCVKKTKGKIRVEKGKLKASWCWRRWEMWKKWNVVRHDMNSMKMLHPIQIIPSIEVKVETGKFKVCCVWKGCDGQIWKRQLVPTLSPWKSHAIYHPCHLWEKQGGTKGKNRNFKFIVFEKDMWVLKHHQPMKRFHLIQKNHIINVGRNNEVKLCCFSKRYERFEKNRRISDINTIEKLHFIPKTKSLVQQDRENR